MFQRFLSPGFIAGTSIIVVVALGATVQMTRQYGGEKSAAAERRQVLAAIEQLMTVPPEQPIVATITQAATLASQQPFYAGALNGDVLVIFPQAQSAVIYSPARHRIVNSGPFVLNSGSADPTTAGATLKKPIIKK